MKHKPAGITANRNTKTLTIRWEDGHQSDYHFSLLRFACPCVECKGGHDNMSDLPDPAVFTMAAEESQRTAIENIVPIGSYAVSIEWGDGHSAGIYNWDFLRLLCPCDSCRA